MPILQSPSVHRLAFREVVRALRADPKLAAAVKQWRWFSREPGDGGDIELKHEHCPMVRLRPVAGPPARRHGTDGTNHVYELPLSVEVETAIAAEAGRGLDQGEALDLSALIYGALWPEDPADRATLDGHFRSAGVSDVRLVQPILPVYYDDLFIGSRGVVELVQHANF